MMKNQKLIAAALLTTIAWVGNVQSGTLSDSPLSLKGSVPPNVVFALSVEFPTAVTAAYRVPGSATDNTYAAANEYLGYFDPDKCYTYDSGNGWFAPAGAASSRTCSGQWSGNFMNWATMAGLDEFRYAMSGGNRYRDTATLTVLERTFLDNHTGKSSYFPDKIFSGTGATPYGGSITLTSERMGVATRLTSTGTDSISCTSPALAAPFTCTLSVVSSSTPVACTTWSGDGNSAATPYSCATFGAGFPAGGTATPGTAAAFSTTPVADTVSCTSPSYSGSFNCNLTLSGGTAGSCTTWSGTGTGADPFYCSDFGPFGATDFAASSMAAASSFVSSTTTTTNTRVPASGTSSYNCTINNPSTTGRSISCNIGNGYTATASSYSGTPRIFSSFSSSPSGANILSATPDTSGPTVTCGTRTCYTRYNIAYTYPTTTSTPTTRYYIPTYPGNTGTTKYYITSYSLSFGGSVDLNVRVKVCDSSVGLESNCKAFGSAYKPTGVLQDEGDKMKFGVFSYYNSPDIDNAVMRSKAKYLAPQKYSSSGGTVANTSKEWSETDGTLISDPDPSERTNSYPTGTPPARSGVVNYMNQFGRPVTLPATLPHSVTTYKGYDPVGKLYYEALKYLRGGQATTHFYQNATATTNDDFPIITNWDDPIQFSCQKNYIIALGDKNTHCDKRLPGGTITSGNVGGTQCSGRPEADDYGSFSETGVTPTVDVSTWTDAMATWDAATGVGATNRTGSGSNGSWYMSGLAYWAAKNDIRTDDATKPNTLGTQKVKTYVIDVEEGGALSWNRQFGLAAKYGGADTFDTSGQPLNSTSPVTIGGTAYDWPKTLLRASDPKKMITSVRSAIADIVAQIGTESALAQSSGDLQTGSGAYIYRATFNSGGWIGDVDAYRIDSNGVIASTAAWKASAKLPAHGSRRILTFNDGLQPNGTSESDTNSRQGVPFTANTTTDFNSNFSSRQRDFLDRDATGTADAGGIARVNYLRGDNANEGAGLNFRARATALGDMVNSNPLYVGAPIAGLVGNGYNTFANSVKNRKPMVYVGGNDGMVHGYDASVNADGSVPSGAGIELLAYVPSAVYSRLSKLTSPSYSHLYYVDGSPVASEACFNNCASGVANWKTMLVGGMNAGGQGIYALDITNPAGFATDAPSSLVLWEFTDRDDEHLGYTFSKPIVRKMNNDKWAVIFGNGFNNTAADGHASSTGRAYLYVVYVTGPTGSGNTWTLGTDYLRFELKSPSEGATPTLPLSPANGLASISGVDSDANGAVDFIYAGDRYGNIWKIDVSDSSSSNWASAFDDGAATPTPLPLFTTSDGAATPAAQQVTTSVEVSRHPNGGFMVLFGTGSYIDITDTLSPFKTDSYYGIWDKNDAAKTRVTSRSSLQQQKVLSTVIDGSTTYYYMSSCAPNYTSAVVTAGNVSSPLCPSDIGTSANLNPQLGWLFDLPGSGERVVSDRPLLQAGVLTFTTLTPSTDPCTGNTVGKEYNLDYLTGGALKSPIFDLNGDGIINSSDYRTVTITTAGGPVTIQVAPSGRQLVGGASDTPVRFKRPKQSYDPSSTAVCTDFVPGWGCPSKLGPPQACKTWVQDVVSQEFMTSLTGGSLTSAPMKCLNAASGRMTWRQILQ